MPLHRPCGLPSVESTHSFWHREPSTLLKAHRSTRDLPQTADVVIIGSGITGASVAHHIFDQGRPKDWKPNVVMLEAREACWGATGRNGGHCQPLLLRGPHDPSLGRFELNNYNTLQALIAEKSIDCEFVAQPGVRGVYGATEVEHVEAALTTMDETAPDLRRYMRVVKAKEDLIRYRVPDADAALITAVAARMWPYKFVAHILESLLTDPNHQSLFNLQTLTPVESINQMKGHWLVHTLRGTVKAEHVILATNGYTSHLVPSFADLLVPCRGQMSALEPPTYLSGPQRLKTSLGFENTEIDEYLIQRPAQDGEHLMFGGGRNLAPSLGITDDSVIDPTIAPYLRKTLPNRYAPANGGHASELKAANEWTGIMGFSRDAKPWVGPMPGVDGLYLSVGYTGHGMPNAWLCGKAIAGIVTDVAHGAAQADAVKSAQAETSLPEAYLLTAERMEAAKKLDLVEETSNLGLGQA